MAYTKSNPNGQTTMANSSPVVVASDQSTLPTTDQGSGKTLKRASVALAESGDIIALVASRRIKVYAYACQSLNDSMTLTIKDGSAGSTIVTWTLNAREGVVGSSVNPPSFIFATTAGTALYGTISGTGTVNVSVSYWDEDAS